MRHECPFFLFKSEKKTDEGQLKQMRQVPENLFFLAHLSQRLIGELIVYPWSGVRRTLSVRRRRP